MNVLSLKSVGYRSYNPPKKWRTCGLSWNMIKLKWKMHFFSEPHPAPEISGIGNCWLCLNYAKNQLEPLLCQRKKAWSWMRFRRRFVDCWSLFINVWYIFTLNWRCNIIWGVPKMVVPNNHGLSYWKWSFWSVLGVPSFKETPIYLVVSNQKNTRVKFANTWAAHVILVVCFNDVADLDHSFTTDLWNIQSMQGILTKFPHAPSNTSNICIYYTYIYVNIIYISTSYLLSFQSNWRCRTSPLNHHLGTIFVWITCCPTKIRQTCSMFVFIQSWTLLLFLLMRCCPTGQHSKSFPGVAKKKSRSRKKTGRSFLGWNRVAFKYTSTRGRSSRYSLNFNVTPMINWTCCKFWGLLLLHL